MKRNHDHNPNEQVKKLNELIGDIKVAMLTTIDEEGHLHSRPMMTMQTDSDGELWFYTARSSGKALSIAHDDRVNLAYSEPKDSRFISVAGRAAIVNDHDKIKELWKPVYKAWFPEGLEDPELTLLKVSIDSAEYWDPVSSKLVQMVGYAKAIMTGKPYESGTENQRVSLNH